MKTTYFIESSDGRLWGSYTTKREGKLRLKQVADSQRAAGFQGFLSLMAQTLGSSAVSIASVNLTMTDAAFVRAFTPNKHGEYA